MTELDLDAIKALTPDQRATIDASVAGGLVAYIHRLLDGHRPAFSRGRDDELVFRGCRCDDVLCNRWAFAIHLNDVLTAYESKIEDFAAETRRSSALVAEVERLRLENVGLRRLRLAVQQACTHDSKCDEEGEGACCFRAWRTVVLAAGCAPRTTIEDVELLAALRPEEPSDE